jgi:hypothetical protein
MDSEPEAVMGYLAGVITMALTDPAGPLRQPVVLEEPRTPGVIRLRLRSGMTATVLVQVEPAVDYSQGWYHRGHYHPAGDEPHEHW